MEGLVGALVVVFSIGATAAALLQPISEIIQAIMRYLRGIYGPKSTRTDLDQR